MGLDNGLVSKNITRDEIPSWVKLPFDKDYIKGEVEFVYFRKHWGIRGEILAKLHCVDTNDSYTPVEAEDIIPLTKILMKYLDKEYYEENADSIWEYDEAVEGIKQAIINLMWLKMYMGEHPEKSCYFYDSY